MPNSLAVTIFHNPACGTSRNTLALIRNAGIEPTVVEYLRTPPDSAALQALLQAMGMGARALLREKEKIWPELLAASGKPVEEWTEAELVAAMVTHPALLNRPVVVTPWGTRLCRPSEAVLDILPVPQRGPFAKEDGEMVIDAAGTRVR
jgi:arsenate reductase